VKRGVVIFNGETYEVKDLYVADGSILPTSICVNSQVPIMTMATRLAWRLGERLSREARRTPKPPPEGARLASHAGGQARDVRALGSG
jgi:choline dehydrogenase-like flavoprotein